MRFAFTVLAALITLAPMAAAQESQPATAPASQPAASDNPYADLLGATVRGGFVNYAKLQAEYTDELDAHLATVADASPARMESEAERLAFYINAYNAAVLRFILDHYPVNSVMDIGQEKFFDEMKIAVGGRELSLNELEKEVIRGFGDPRYHFVLVCGAESCPKLLNRPLEAKDLDKTLDKAARAFIQDKDNVHVDFSKNQLRLSRIFDWYHDEFVTPAGGVGEYLAGYLPKVEAEFLRDADPAVVYQDYSWALNNSRI